MTTLPKHYLYKFLRILGITAISLVALYTFLGFVIVPLAAKYYANQAINDYTEWNLVLDDIHLNPFDLSLKISQAHLLTPDGEKEFGFSQFTLDIDAIDTLKTFLSAAPQKAYIQNVSLSAPYGEILIKPSGDLKVLDRLKPAPETEKTEPLKEDENQTPVHWVVKHINLENGELRFLDHRPDIMFEQQINRLNISLTDVSDQLSNYFPYSIDFGIDDAQTSLQGEIAPIPLSMKGNIDLSNINLALPQPYLNTLTHLALSKGRLNVSSNYDISYDTELQGELTTSLSIVDFDAKDRRDEQTLVAFSSLELDNSQANFSDQTFSVGPATLNDPIINLTINESGQLSLASLQKENETSEQPTPENQDLAEESPAPKGTQSQFTIKGFAINNGSIGINDASIAPTFVNQISNLNIAIDQYDGISTSTLDLKMDLLTEGSLKVSGQVSPISKGSTDVSVQLQNLSLSELSAYTQHFTGYPIKDGKLNLDLAYLINDQQLDADHKIFIDHIDFDSKSNDKPVVSAPLPLLVGMLEDGNQLIKLDIPVGGDLSNPEVNVLSLVLDGLQVFFTKLITSPFSMLGSIVGYEGDLSGVYFEAGQSGLSAEQTTRLQQISRVLADRPKLALRIQGVSIADIDLPALEAVQGKPLVDPAASLKLLAAQRAKYIYSYLTKELAIPADRVSISGDEPEKQSAGDKIKAHFVIEAI